MAEMTLAEAPANARQEFTVAGEGGTFGVTLTWEHTETNNKRWEVCLWQEIERRRFFGLIRRRRRRVNVRSTNIRRLAFARRRYDELMLEAERMAHGGLGCLIRPSDARPKPKPRSPRALGHNPPPEENMPRTPPPAPPAKPAELMIIEVEGVAAIDLPDLPESCYAANSTPLPLPPHRRPSAPGAAK